MRCNYSSLGSGEKQEGDHALLLCIWMRVQFSRGTPLIVHANVPGLVSDTLSSEAASYGYDTFQIACKPRDANVYVSRPRMSLVLHKQALFPFPAPVSRTAFCLLQRVLKATR